KETDDRPHDRSCVRLESKQPGFQTLKGMPDLPTFDPPIETPCAWPCSHDPQIQIAKQDSLLAAICDRPKATGSPGLKIGDSHFTAKDECAEPRKQDQQEQ